MCIYIYYTYTDVYIYTHIYIYMLYVCSYACMHVGVDIYIYMYTYATPKVAEADLILQRRNVRIEYNQDSQLPASGGWGGLGFPLVHPKLCHGCKGIIQGLEL